MSTNPDPVGEGIAAAPCTLTNEANRSYAKGYVDGMNGTGHSGTHSNGTHSHGTYSNGDKYNHGKLVAFRASNGTTYRVRNRMDNR